MKNPALVTAGYQVQIDYPTGQTRVLTGTAAVASHLPAGTDPASILPGIRLHRELSNRLIDAALDSVKGAAAPEDRVTVHLTSPLEVLTGYDARLAVRHTSTVV